MTTHQIENTTDNPTAGLSESEIFAYYKRTAPVEDVQFALRLNPPEDVRAGFVALLALLESKKGKATPETRREYARLHSLWRLARMTYTPSTRDVDKAWTIYYRDAKGLVCQRNAKGQLTPIYGCYGNCIIKPWTGKPEKSANVAKAPIAEAPAVQVPTPGPQIVQSNSTTRICRTCSQEQPLDQFTWGDGGRTVRNMCLRCRKAQQRDTAARRKQAA